MPKYPEDKLVRPIKVMVKERGAAIVWRLPKDLPQSEYKETLIIRSEVYDYQARNKDLIERKGIPIDNQWRVDQPLKLVDTNVKPNTSYTYYIYVVDNQGNYHHPGPATGKVIEDGASLLEKEEREHKDRKKDEHKDKKKDEHKDKKKDEHKDKKKDEHKDKKKDEHKDKKKDEHKDKKKDEHKDKKKDEHKDKKKDEHKDKKKKKK
ncbi:MAG: hypothetical protein ACTSU5_19535 [Promethearchaeota archaeon]